MSARRPMQPPTRRQVLRGAGVALGLPWLESLQPRTARAATASPARHFVAMYFPGGVAPFWKPAASGQGDAWRLSPILAPLQPLKTHVSVLSNVGNGGPFATEVTPSAASLTAAFLTCTRPKLPRANAGDALCGISVDQVIASQLGRGRSIPSLQLGLATGSLPPDGLPASFSRAVSWASRSRPLYRVTRPRTIFDRLVSDGAVPVTSTASPTDPAAAARRAANRSVLDFVRKHATSVKQRLGTDDRARLDQYLTSVREVEEAVDTAGTPQGECPGATAPPDSFGSNNGVTPANYSRDAHADVMIDLLVLALRCSATSVVSLMMDDAGSPFAYDLPGRTFTVAGSTAAAGRAQGSVRALQGAGPAGHNTWASITYWMVSKLARLGSKLHEISDSQGATLLDTSVIWFGSEAHGAGNDARDLPVLTLGKGGGLLQTDQHVDFGAALGQELSNVYLTFIQKVFGVPVFQFGENLREKLVPRSSIADLLA